MRTFTHLKNEEDLINWDDAQRIVNFHLMKDHLQSIGVELTENEADKVFEWSFETAYDSDNYCYNFDTVNYALLCYIRDNGFASLETKMSVDDNTIMYNEIIVLVNNYCDLENDYKKIYQ